MTVPSRTDLALAQVAMGFAVVAALVWFWLMIPVLGPTVWAGSVWAAVLLGLPPAVVFVGADRVIARRLSRPGSLWRKGDR